MDARADVGFVGVAGGPELLEEGEDGGKAVDVVVVFVCEDDVGYVWAARLNLYAGLEEGFAQEGDVFVEPLGGVYEDVGVGLPDEVGVCSWYDYEMMGWDVS